MDKQTYWAVFKDTTTVYEGTFTQCWAYLVDEYKDYTVSQLAADKIRIGRKS